MLCILNNISNDPYFNLAAEEYVLKTFTDDLFMLWQNEKSVICGKYQNAAAEINFDFVKENGIKVVRRLTGGGAVFHDLGNINFTFINQQGEGDFQSFTQPILQLLQNLGVPATFEGRNDLMINGMKFSGNAQCLYEGKIMHHGTLLYDANKADISASLKVNPLKFQDKAVKSVSKRITNISDHLPTPMPITQFIDTIMTYAETNFPNAMRYTFTPEDITAINHLRDTKYSTWEWNFGASPKFNYNKMIRTAGGSVEVMMTIEKGHIECIKIWGDFFAKGDIEQLESLFIGVAYQEDAIADLLAHHDVATYIAHVTNEEMLKLLF